MNNHTSIYQLYHHILVKKSTVSTKVGLHYFFDIESSYSNTCITCNIYKEVIHHPKSYEKSHQESTITHLRKLSFSVDVDMIHSIIIDGTIKFNSKELKNCPFNLKSILTNTNVKAEMYDTIMNMKYDILKHLTVKYLIHA